MKTPKERETPDLLELVCQLHSRSCSQPNNKQMHDFYVEARQELDSRIVAYQNLVKADVIKSVCEDCREGFPKTITNECKCHICGAKI